MVNPIKVWEGPFFSEVTMVDNGEEIVGHFKVELLEDMALLHSEFYDHSPSSIKLGIKIFKEVAHRMRDKYHYLAIHGCTQNERFTKVITENKAYPIGTGTGGILYEYDMR